MLRQWLVQRIAADDIGQRQQGQHHHHDAGHERCGTLDAV
jgi:hypothetical protein